MRDIRRYIFFFAVHNYTETHENLSEMGYCASQTFFSYFLITTIYTRVLFHEIQFFFFFYSTTFSFYPAIVYNIFPRHGRYVSDFRIEFFNVYAIRTKRSGAHYPNRTPVFPMTTLLIFIQSIQRRGYSL